MHLNVLVLVLMEYALRPEIQNCDTFGDISLNPCFNGICSKTREGRSRLLQL